MAAPVVYKSTDASAPTLSGTAGDLVNLLDKILADGYGAKAAAGWTKSFTATNQRVYRPAAGNQFYLDVDDRGATSVLTSASGKEAAVRAYETMSAVSAGTAPFPTTAQIAAATANWRKSASADAVIRSWTAVADDRTMMLFILDGDTAGLYKSYYFGDFYSIKSGDGYRTFVSTRSVVNSAAATGCLLNVFSTSWSNNLAGQYIARIGAGTGASINAGLLSIGSAPHVHAQWANAWDDKIYLAKVLVSESAVPYMRGWLRGIYPIINPAGLNDGDTFDGTGEMAGRSFMILQPMCVASTAYALETTAWDTSS